MDFLFLLGGYIGYNYERVLSFLEKYLVIMIMLALGSYVLFIAISGDDYWNVTSFTYSLTLYNSVMFFVLVGICAHFKTMLLNTVQMISAFSFFIYLLHPIILDSLFAYTNIFEDNTVVFLAVSLLMILGICIGVGMILREFYILGSLLANSRISYSLIIINLVGNHTNVGKAPPAEIKLTDLCGWRFGFVVDYFL